MCLSDLLSRAETKPAAKGKGKATGVGKATREAGAASDGRPQPTPARTRGIFAGLGVVALKQIPARHWTWHPLIVF